MDFAQLEVEHAQWWEKLLWDQNEEFESLTELD